MTLPPPFPCFVYVKFSWTRLKVAVTDRASLMVTVHEAAVPLQAPDHPANSELGAACALRVTVVPTG